MLAVKKVSLYSSDFSSQEDYFYATIQHELNTQNYMVLCSSEEGSVIFEYEKPDMNQLHIKLVEPCTVDVFIVYKE